MEQRSQNSGMHIKFWNAYKYAETSNLRGNIESKTFWKEHKKELTRVVVTIGHKTGR